MNVGEDTVRQIRSTNPVIKNSDTGLDQEG
jgi:hypothetical protein